MRAFYTGAIVDALLFTLEQLWMSTSLHRSNYGCAPLCTGAIVGVRLFAPEQFITIIGRSVYLVSSKTQDSGFLGYKLVSLY